MTMAEDDAPITQRTERARMSEDQRREQEADRMLSLVVEQNSEGLRVAVGAKQAAEAAKREASAARREVAKLGANMWGEHADHRRRLEKLEENDGAIMRELANVAATAKETQAIVMGDYRKRAESLTELEGQRALSDELTKRAERITHLEKRRATYRSVVILLGILATVATVAAAVFGAH